MVFIDPMTGHLSMHIVIHRKPLENSDDTLDYIVIAKCGFYEHSKEIAVFPLVSGVNIMDTFLGNVKNMISSTKVTMSEMSNKDPKCMDYNGNQQVVIIG